MTSHIMEYLDLVASLAPQETRWIVFFALMEPNSRARKIDGVKVVPESMATH